MPSLGGATEWLNTEPLGLAELRGHVVLVNFWGAGIQQLGIERCSSSPPTPRRTRWPSAN